MMLIESALLSGASVGVGTLFTWWSTPLVVSMISSPVAPTKLALPLDWGVLGFCATIAFAVVISLALPAALHVSGVKPMAALKGDAVRWRGRLMHSLIAVQAGFCFLVLFVGTLFVTSFERLSNQPTGFSSDRVLTLETLTAKPVKAVFWEQVADRLRSLPDVAAVGLSEWPLLTGENWSNLISVNGAPPRQTQSYLLSTSPTWRGVMRIPLLDGRDFRASDRQPGVAIVNNAFAKEYFGGEDPVGKSFDMVSFSGDHISFRVVGRVANARYRNMREPMMPVAYLPFSEDYSRGTYIVRTAGPNPLALSATLRRAISTARPDFFVSNIRTQNELIDSHTVRERVLAMLAVFFGAVALLLAGVGFYGLLDYTVLQRRREFGIRMALGAAPGGIAIRMTGQAFARAVLGMLVGFAFGLASARHIQSLLFGVKATDVSTLAAPGVTILLVSLIAAAPAMLRATRVDPAVTLRSEWAPTLPANTIKLPSGRFADDKSAVVAMCRGTARNPGWRTSKQ
jgi:putative ABC transport system permease protein